MSVPHHVHFDIGGREFLAEAAIANNAIYVWDATNKRFRPLTTLSGLTLTAPTIADFTNAAHDHGDADDGGGITGSQAITLTTAAQPNVTSLGQLTRLDVDKLNVDQSADNSTVTTGATSTIATFTTGVFVGNALLLLVSARRGNGGDTEATLLLVACNKYDTPSGNVVATLATISSVRNTRVGFTASTFSVTTSGNDVLVQITNNNADSIAVAAILVELPNG